MDMIGVAAGLADGGKIPFVAGASCFMTARGLEQIKVDLAYSGANVKLCAMSPGVAYGALGPTHHSIEDIAWLRAIANLPIVVPADPVETESALRFAATAIGPFFIRVSRMHVPRVYPTDYEFRLGEGYELRAGHDVTLIANGTMVTRALVAAEALARGQGIQSRVLSMPTVKPLDIKAIEAAARETAGIVTVEEHSIYGGLGGAVAEVVATTHPVPMRILGIPGVFSPTGSAEWILEYFGLTPEGICEAALELLAKTQPS